MPETNDQRPTASMIALPRCTCALGLICALAFSGCGPRRGITPDATVDQYAQAIEAQRWEDAYRLLSEAGRARISLAEFKRLMLQNQREVSELLSRAQQTDTPPHVTAKIRTQSGVELSLIYQDGSWRIDESAVDFYSQKDPRLALGSFVRAYDHKRYDVLLRFVPQRERAGMTVETLKDAWEGALRVEVEQIVEGIRVSYQTAKLEILGEHATMSYGSGATVEMILENGSWKIENFQ